MKVPIGSALLEVVQGDISVQEVDAVVNAANNHLWMGSGVAGAIKKRGGQAIENEAVSQGPIEIGESVITTAGDLPSEYVIHAAGMGQDLHTDEERVRKATISSMRLAEEKSLTSIAFPAIGTGVGGLEIHLCAKTMLNEAVNILMTTKSLKLIRFVLFDNDSFAIFETELKNIFSAGR